MGKSSMARTTTTTKPQSIEPILEKSLLSQDAPTLSECPKCHTQSLREVSPGYSKCERCDFSQGQSLAALIFQEPSFSKSNHQAFSLTFLGSIFLTIVTILLLV
jgi:hypothetical protein